MQPVEGRVKGAQVCSARFEIQKAVPVVTKRELQKAQVHAAKTGWCFWMKTGKIRFSIWKWQKSPS